MNTLSTYSALVKIHQNILVPNDSGSSPIKYLMRFQKTSNFCKKIFKNKQFFVQQSKKNNLKRNVKKRYKKYVKRTRRAHNSRITSHSLF